MEDRLRQVIYVFCLSVLPLGYGLLGWMESRADLLFLGWSVRPWPPDLSRSGSTCLFPGPSVLDWDTNGALRILTPWL